MRNYKSYAELQVAVFVKELTTSYAVNNVTSDRQLRNGTIAFKHGDEFFAIYKSGIVRTYNKHTCYQLNLTRQRMKDYMYRNLGRLLVRSSVGTIRVLIPQEIDRLLYLKNYLIKNRGMKEINKESLTV